MDRQKMLDDIILEIKRIKNPYPKDIFPWDSQKNKDITIGRFNQHVHMVFENTRNEIISTIEDVFREPEIHGDPIDKVKALKSAFGSRPELKPFDRHDEDVVE